LGAFSFHETKNYHCGEGGALLINSDAFVERAEIIREKGTNRSRFFRGQVDKYTWIDMGSSYLPSELNTAFLFAQLPHVLTINDNRLQSWSIYNERLKHLADLGLVEMPHVPNDVKHNAHMFYLKVKDLKTRTNLIDYLGKSGIQSAFHYVPLHSSPAGVKFGQFCGKDLFTTFESDRLLRLPLWFNISAAEVNFICDEVENFYKL
jgi:dTDP-4-amino-4,6-dideoxygalactose transaminase